MGAREDVLAAVPADRVLTVQQITEVVKCWARPTVSHQLRILAGEGLVRKQMRQRATWSDQQENVYQRVAV